jgi:hypothetical protein
MRDALKVTGGCQCGAVRYRADVAPATAHICHCRMCQKAAGNYFMALASAPLSTFKVTRGMIAHFGSSESVRRGFCSRCGTPLTFESIGARHINVTLGSLDEPAAIVPMEQSGIESRVPWFARLADIREEASGASELDGGARIAKVLASNRQHPDHETAAWPQVS